ncbi:hypothetical protein CLOM_g13571 [Closterium sp. NIES-68]|nr:hypothetical protein CLOM_g13571 [Closterium sp. NIES-68]
MASRSSSLSTSCVWDLRRPRRSPSQRASPATREAKGATGLPTRPTRCCTGRGAPCSGAAVLGFSLLLLRALSAQAARVNDLERRLRGVCGQQAGEGGVLIHEIAAPMRGVVGMLRLLASSVSDPMHLDLIHTLHAFAAHLTASPLLPATRGAHRMAHCRC